MNLQALFLAMNDTEVFQLVATITLALTVAYIILTLKAHLTRTPEQKAEARRREEYADAVHEAADKEEAARKAEKLAANPPPRATVRGGLMKAGVLLMLLGVGVVMFLGFGPVEMLLLVAGIILLVVGACLPGPASEC